MEPKSAPVVPPSQPQEKRVFQQSYSPLQIFLASVSMATQQQLVAALERLPPETTRAARHALACGMSLTQEQRVPNNVWDTAVRFAAYWEKRRALFGGSYAFASLDQYFKAATSQNTGACSSEIQERVETIEIFRSGFIVELQSDDSGRPVVWVDYSRIESVTGKRITWARHGNHILRCIFYFCHSHPQWLNLVLVALLSEQDSPWDRLMLHPVLDILQRCFVFQFHAVHLCLLMNQAAQWTMVPTVMQAFHQLDPLPLHFHCDNSVGMRKKLQYEGIPLKLIPRSIGGLWDYRIFTDSFSNDNPQGIRRDWTEARSGVTPSNALSGATTHMDLMTATNHTQVSLVSAGTESSVLAPQATGSAAMLVHASSATMNPASLVLDEGSYLETTMMQQEGVRQLEEALDMLSLEDKAAYQAALRQVPHLVVLESNPIRFLRYHKYNAWAAARQLANYWKKRVEIFGEQSFLPLTISGEGALAEEDIEQVNSGYFMFLPGDIFGRSVLCYDPTRRKYNTLQSRLRVGFYYWSILCENDLSATDGFVGLAMLGRGSFNPLDTTIKDCVDMVVETFPTLPSSLHIVNSPSGLGQRIFFDLLLPLAIRFMGRMINERTAVHVGDPDDLVVKLSQYGLMRQNLPDYIGGACTFHAHHQWLEDRLALEYSRYSAYIPMKRRSSSIPRNIPSSSVDLLRSSSHSTVAEEAKISDDAILIEYSDLVIQTVEAMPSSTKEAYVKAITHVPELVSKESCMAPFLRLSDFNIQAAALRLVKYWQTRCEVFGKKAFLPLQQTGEGALDRKDIATISSGYLLSLPKDPTGRSIVFCDGSRLSKSSRESRLRSTFYMYSIAAENVKTQTGGIVLLYVLTEASFDRANKECLQLVVDSLPLKISEVHLLQHSDGDDESVPAHNIDAEMLAFFHSVATGNVHHHSSRTKTSLSQCLTRHGLPATCLPKSIGGKYGFDSFVQWQELRTRFEWDLPAGVSNKEDEVYFDFSRVKRLADLSADEKNERKRKLNVIHSRRKRERERIEVEVLEEQYLELSEEKSNLIMEEKRLNDLLHQAQACLP